MYNLRRAIHFYLLMGLDQLIVTLYIYSIHIWIFLRHGLYHICTYEGVNKITRFCLGDVSPKLWPPPHQPLVFSFVWKKVDFLWRGVFDSPPPDGDRSPQTFFYALTLLWIHSNVLLWDMAYELDFVCFSCLFFWRSFSWLIHTYIYVL